MYRAKRVLEEIMEIVKETLVTSLKLEFSGIDTFRNDVVFVKMKDGPAKDKLCEIAGKLCKIKMTT